ncbi:MAG TPA: pantetheine-phosphate adenylyltransferase [Clostridiales bacterium]|nr:pantetheine-phosphate adenylyltransferase [Clostridiales bacterium]
MRTLIYPGSFDPFTNGHVDIASRAARLCDRLYIAILTNSAKKQYFTAAERVKMAQLAMQDYPNVLVESYGGLLVDFYRMKNANAVVRGLRSESDFRFEAEIAAANKLLLPDYETCLLPCRIDLAFTSSSIVREVASYGGSIDGMVPASIADIIRRKLNNTHLTALQPD